jgi:hypothetical protein
MISDGSDVPLRCKVRSPCFTAISAIDAIVQETKNPASSRDAVAMVVAPHIVLGEIDRCCITQMSRFQYRRSSWITATPVCFGDQLLHSLSRSGRKAGY